MPGPPPKRSDQRRRQNKPSAPIETAPAARKVTVPPTNGKWHPVAKRWYQSLRKSGQSRFYEPSDWATAYLIAEAMSRELNPQVVGYYKQDGERVPIFESRPPGGASLAAWLKAMTALMVTEGDRRRMRLELERPAPGGDGEDASVTLLDDYRSELAKQ